MAQVPKSIKLPFPGLLEGTALFFYIMQQNLSGEEALLLETTLVSSAVQGPLEAAGRGPLSAESRLTGLQEAAKPQPSHPSTNRCHHTYRLRGL